METLVSFELLPAEIAELQDGPPNSTPSIDLLCQAIIRAYLRRQRHKVARKAFRASVRAQRTAGHAIREA